MPETAENVAQEFGIDRAAQDRMAVASQSKALAAQRAGLLRQEITPVRVAQKKGDPVSVDQDEHPRETTLEALGLTQRAQHRPGTGQPFDCVNWVDL